MKISDADIMSVLAETWPPASTKRSGNWVVREGSGGGKRVSATTSILPVYTDVSSPDIAIAENEMEKMNQENLFMIRPNEIHLDQALEDRGYLKIDPVTIYCCHIDLLVDQYIAQNASISRWPPLEIAKKIWSLGGVCDSKIAVMDRVSQPKATILGRLNGHVAGCAFTAISKNIAMIHALEVSPAMRRKNVGHNIILAAAHWALHNSAKYFSLAVTDENKPAIELYNKFRLTVVSHYHYRIKT